MRTLLEMSWILVLVSLAAFFLCSGFGTDNVVDAAKALAPPFWAVVVVAVAAVAAAAVAVVYDRHRRRKKWYQFWR